MMSQSAGYDDWYSDGETEFKWDLLKGCLFWVMIFVGVPVLIYLITEYWK